VHFTLQSWIKINGIRTTRYLDISVLNICDISVLGTGHIGTWTSESAAGIQYRFYLLVTELLEQFKEARDLPMTLRLVTEGNCAVTRERRQGKLKVDCLIDGRGIVTVRSLPAIFFPVVVPFTADHKQSKHCELQWLVLKLFISYDNNYSHGN
jgi:hypothetical protein